MSQLVANAAEGYVYDRVHTRCLYELCSCLPNENLLWVLVGGKDNVEKMTSACIQLSSQARTWFGDEALVDKFLMQCIVFPYACKAVLRKKSTE